MVLVMDAHLVLAVRVLCDFPMPPPVKAIEVNNPANFIRNKLVAAIYAATITWLDKVDKSKELGANLKSKWAITKVKQVAELKSLLKEVVMHEGSTSIKFDIIKRICETLQIDREGNPDPGCTANLHYKGYKP